MENFDGIVEFVAVAEAKSFSAAAKQLGCSTSHVSRQVSRLESRLESILLARTTRLVSLTNTGLAYYQRCKDLVMGLQQANEQLNVEKLQLSGTLRVSAAGTFAEEYVAPALMAFAQKHPELAIDIDFNSRMVNFVEDGIDFAIRYGQLKDSNLIARKLLDRPMMAAASENYIKQYGSPDSPEQLKHHSCIISNNDHWLFEKDGHIENVKIQGRWRSNNARAVIQACEQGLGIAYLPQVNFNNSLDLGKLTPVLKPYWSNGSGSWIVYQNKRFLQMRVRLAIDFLLKHFANWEEQQS